LTKATQKNYAALLKKDLAKKCRSETAGAMASLLAAHVAEGVEYPGRDKHVKDVTAYLGRTTRLKYRQEDLESVCEFLKMVSKRQASLPKLVERGVKEHPGSPVLQMMAGVLEFEKGPFQCRPRVAHQHLEKALKLAEQSTRPSDAALVPRIKQVLSIVNELLSKALDFGFGGFPFGEGGPRFSPGFKGFSGNEDDEDDDDEDRPFFGRGFFKPGGASRKQEPKSSPKK
jgi:hypothetical protein